MNITADRSWAKAYHISFSELHKGTTFEQKNMGQGSELLQFLEVFADSIHSPALQVTGSLFVKRYSLLIAGAMHGFIRKRDAIDLSPERLKLVWNENALHFIIDGSGATSFQCKIQDEEAIRERYFDHVFADQVCPMLNRIAELTKIDEDTLWGNVSFSLAYWKNDWLQSSSLTEEDRNRIEEDYADLMVTFNRSRFPNRADNPLQGVFRKAHNPLDSDKPIMIRSKCCLYYCLPGNSKHCYTCPRITDEKRIETYGEIHGITGAKEILKQSK